jgi:hypothetical protein
VPRGYNPRRAGPEQQREALTPALRGFLEWKAPEAAGPAAGDPPSDLPPDLFELWEERVAIVHFDGGLPWPDAEAAALADVLRRSE